MLNLNEIYTSALSAVIFVSLLYVMTRIMGKKQISKLTYFDYVAGIVIGTTASNIVINPDISVTRGVTALFVFSLFPIILSFISQKSYLLRGVLEGKPTVLIENGFILRKNLKHSKMTINDLQKECRAKNVFDIENIEYAILETSGKLSVLKKSQYQPLTPNDMNIQTKYKGLCRNVVIDGQIIEDQLIASGHNKYWLMSELKKKNINNVESVLLGYINSSNELVTYPKTDLVSEHNNI